MLRVEGLSVRYGAIQAVRGVDLRCEASELVALVGPNGAGKSSILRTIAGARGGARVSGDVWLGEELVLGRTPESLVDRGIALVPEGRRIFGSLSVEENLGLAAGRRPGPWSLDVVFERFPALSESRHRPAGLLSGGQQQQLAIGRALMTNPRFLLCDEPSLGLAPKAIDEVFLILEGLRQGGVGVILVEQNATRAVELASTAYALHKGEIEQLRKGGQDIDPLLGRFGESRERGPG